MKIAVVTPYHRETIDTLRKCRKSVQDQTIKCHHYMVADGFPQTWIDDEPRNVIHLKLSNAHGDCGNTPRGLGALLAFRDGADAICFLDADNTFDPDHVEHCLETARRNIRASYVAALRRIVLPDGTLVPTQADENRQLVDTSCYFMLPGSFHALGQWLMQPRELSSICDRLFLAYLNKLGLQRATCTRTTVTYVSHYAVSYRSIGRRPPADARIASVDVDWIRRLPQQQWNLIRQRMGVDQLPE